MKKFQFYLPIATLFEVLYSFLYLTHSEDFISACDPRGIRLTQESGTIKFPRSKNETIAEHHFCKWRLLPERNISETNEVN